ncbi:MAG: HlyD family efflux transporter periplasmic adaptor subunit, partial [Turicibacter sp.]
DVLMLSNKAITLKDGKQVVNVKNEDGTVTETEITTGFSDGKNSEIISGLSEGDTVVVGG